MTSHCAYGTSHTVGPVRLHSSTATGSVLLLGLPSAHKFWIQLLPRVPVDTGLRAYEEPWAFGYEAAEKALARAFIQSSLGNVAGRFDRGGS